MVVLDKEDLERILANDPHLKSLKTLNEEDRGMLNEIKFQPNKHSPLAKKSLPRLDFKTSPNF